MSLTRKMEIMKNGFEGFEEDLDDFDRYNIPPGAIISFKGNPMEFIFVGYDITGKRVLFSQVSEFTLQEVLQVGLAEDIEFTYY